MNRWTDFRVIPSWEVKPWLMKFSAAPEYKGVPTSTRRCPSCKGTLREKQEGKVALTWQGKVPLTLTWSCSQTQRTLLAPVLSRLIVGTETLVPMAISLLLRQLSDWWPLLRWREVMAASGEVQLRGKGGIQRQTDRQTGHPATGIGAASQPPPRCLEEWRSYVALQQTARSHYKWET